MTPPTSLSPADPVRDPAVLRAAAQSGAKWFYWIAALSMINAVILAWNGNISFIMGLSYTYFVLGFFSQFGPAGPALSLLAAAAISAIFALIGHQAFQLKHEAWIIGILLYAIDGGIYCLFGDYWSAAFHGVALFFIISGWGCLDRLKKLETNPGT
jgi:hypothetical protein